MELSVVIMVIKLIEYRGLDPLGIGLHEIEALAWIETWPAQDSIEEPIELASQRPIPARIGLESRKYPELHS